MENIIDQDTPDKIDAVAHDILEMSKDLEALKGYKPTADNSRILLQADEGLGITTKEFAREYPEEYEKLLKMKSFIADKMDEIGNIIG